MVIQWHWGLAQLPSVFGDFQPFPRSLAEHDSDSGSVGRSFQSLRRTCAQESGGEVTLIPDRGLPGVDCRALWETPYMMIEEWWPLLGRDSQTWLVENNGDDVLDGVAAAIAAAGGSVTPGTPLTDEEIDWIEAIANDEVY